MVLVTIEGTEERLAVLTRQRTGGLDFASTSPDVFPPTFEFRFVCFASQPAVRPLAAEGRFSRHFRYRHYATPFSVQLLLDSRAEWLGDQVSDDELAPPLNLDVLNVSRLNVSIQIA